MRLPVLAAVVAALVSGAACTSGPSAPVDPQAYAKTVAEARAIKDKAFREEPEPIPADKRDVLLPLRYYPPDPSYTAPAELKLATNGQCSRCRRPPASSGGWNAWACWNSRCAASR